MSFRGPAGNRAFLSPVRGPAQLVTGEGTRVRIQLLDSSRDHHDYARWPTASTAVALRYSDLPAEVSMDVPTLPAFAAMKTSAWADRRAARGLYDLAGLARIGALTRDSAVLAKAVTGLAVISSMFNRVSDADWEIQLAHQTRDLPEAQRCLIAVRNAYALSLGWPEPADPYD